MLEHRRPRQSRSNPGGREGSRPGPDLAEPAPVHAQGGLGLDSLAAVAWTPDPLHYFAFFGDSRRRDPPSSLASRSGPPEFELLRGPPRFDIRHARRTRYHRAQPHDAL